jgi:malonyl-CoA O-methyltransferase
MKDQTYALNKHAIAQAFSAAAATYDQAAIIEQEIGHRLIQRLDYLKITPQRILDLGSGTGYFTKRLQTLFPQAQIIGLDIAFGMTKFASANSTLSYCGGDAEALPFTKHTFDLIFTNCCFPSITNLPQVFIELNSVLSKNGLLLFSTYGPDTLLELGLTNHWPDMHILGDLLLQHKFIDPVVDSERLTFTYKRMQTLLNDLKNTGNYAVDTSVVENLNSPCSVTIEVIYGHACGSGTLSKQYKDATGHVHVPVDEILYI